MASNDASLRGYRPPIRPSFRDPQINVYGRGGALDVMRQADLSINPDGRVTAEELQQYINEVSNPQNLVNPPINGENPYQREIETAQFMLDNYDFIARTDFNGDSISQNDIYDVSRYDGNPYNISLYGDLGGPPIDFPPFPPPPPFLPDRIDVYGRGGALDVFDDAKRTVFANETILLDNPPLLDNLTREELQAYIERTERTQMVANVTADGGIPFQKELDTAHFMMANFDAIASANGDRTRISRQELFQVANRDRNPYDISQYGDINRPFHPPLPPRPPIYPDIQQLIQQLIDLLRNQFFPPY